MPFAERVGWLGCLLLIFAAPACKTETSPTFEGITTDTQFTVKGADVTMDIAAIQPAAVATITDANPGSIEFSVTCKFPNSGIRWGFYFLREDGTGQVFQAVGCAQTVLQVHQGFGTRNSIEYDFVHGHTARLRLAVAANADALMNGGPYTYLGTRDIVTWTFGQ
jgi:hypothetical protein